VDWAAAAADLRGRFASGYMEWLVLSVVSAAACVADASGAEAEAG